MLLHFCVEMYSLKVCSVSKASSLKKNKTKKPQQKTKSAAKKLNKNNPAEQNRQLW